jgi:manganese/zinc/iron transport system substrate-binding protein
MKLGLLIGLLLALATCVPPERTREKPLVVCTTSIIADGMQKIFGDQVEVRTLMGPGVDPHTYNPRPSDIHWLNEASVIVCNGFHLEGKMVSLFEQIKNRKSVLLLSEYVSQEEQILLDDHVVDPHFWFDSRLWLKSNYLAAMKITKQFDLSFEQVRSNFKAWKIALAEMEKDYMIKLEQIPSDQRVLITSHDAFHYFGRRFDVRVYGIQGISTAQEPSVRAVMDLTDVILKAKVRSIFVENSVNPKTIETLRSACIRKGHLVEIGGVLYSDALGSKESDASTYRDMMEHNLKTVINGLN